MRAAIAFCLVLAACVAPRPAPSNAAPPSLARADEPAPQRESSENPELSSSSVDSDVLALGPLRSGRGCWFVAPASVLASYRGERADVDPRACSLRRGTTDVDIVLVEPASGAPFLVGLANADVTIHLGQEPDLPVPIESRAPLVFKGLTNPTLYSFRHSLDVGGVLHTGLSTRIVHVHALDGTHAAGVVVLGRSAETQELVLPCDDIDVTTSEGQDLVPIIDDSAVRLVPGSELSGEPTVALHAVAGGPVEVALTGERLAFSRIAVGPGGWLLASMRLADGTTARGWAAPGALVSSGGYGYGVIGCGHGVSGGRRRRGGCLYSGPATLLRGADVSAVPHGARWARAAADGQVDVDELADGSFELTRLPGATIESPGKHAFASRDAIKLPSYHRPSGCPTH